MKGVKYNLEFYLPINKETIKFEKLLVSDLMTTIGNNIKEHYNIEMKISRHMIYNLVHRPEKSNRMVRQVCSIMKCSTLNVEKTPVVV
tara:strand:+ start:1175 stop:1438 length:264 start_codon:yes stop_codon:yes gene_type:complete